MRTKVLGRTGETMTTARLIAAAGLAIAALAAQTPTQAQTRDEQACAALAGRFERRMGVDGKQYAIGLAINMPANWNGCFMFQGGGGLNGAIREPTGSQSAGARSALEQGFAVVSTDSSHQGSGFDGSFMNDQQALLNFQFQANAKTAEVALPLVETYYGKAPHHKYFVGCSTGGREGMVMAER